MMDKLIAITFAMYVISKGCGCAYNGDVYLYSPQGAGNVIEKAVSTSAEIPLIP
tara:strand:+ start:454 stop:615 length:162 start_codon:yes stop_codon:yes gene_type:complete